jgi:hypothetical protein
MSTLNRNSIGNKQMQLQSRGSTNFSTIIGGFEKEEFLGPLKKELCLKDP